MSRNSIKKLKTGGRVLLVLYLACLIYFMFFSESYGRTEVHVEYRYNLVLFREIRRFLTYRDILGMPAVLLNVVGNGEVPAMAVVVKLANLSEVVNVPEKDPMAASFLVGTTEYAVPLGNNINVEEELKKLEADLKYNEGFLQSVLKKLGNEKFVNNAPAKVIEMERKKQADAEAKSAALKESIAALKK